MEKWLVLSFFLFSTCLEGTDFPKLLQKCHQHLDIQLKKSENFLEKIALDPEVSEVISKKLYYKKLKAGDSSSSPIQIEDEAYILLEIYEDKPEGEELSWTINEPKKIDLKSCIPGIQQGVVGMTKGEKRRIYMHPFLMQGEYGPLRPYNFIIYDVELASISS